MAILLAVDHWRPYLLRSEFTIKIDQKSLIHLDDQRLQTPWQHKALTKLLGLNYHIVHKKGQENKVADALSRTNHAEFHDLAAVSIVQPMWKLDLQTAYKNDPRACQLLQELTLQFPSGPYTLKDGIIYYKSKIWVGSSSEI